MVDPNLKFLVVDDFSTMRRIVRNLLKELGFNNVDEAEDGVDALSKLRAGSFGFVVSDWNMPNMTGIELLRNIRADANLKGLPFRQAPVPRSTMACSPVQLSTRADAATS